MKENLHTGFNALNSTNRTTHCGLQPIVPSLFAVYIVCSPNFELRRCQMTNANGEEARDPRCAEKGRSVIFWAASTNPDSGVYGVLLLLLYMAGWGCRDGVEYKYRTFPVVLHQRTHLLPTHNPPALLRCWPKLSTWLPSDSFRYSYWASFAWHLQLPSLSRLTTMSSSLEVVLPAWVLQAVSPEFRGGHWC